MASQEGINKMKMSFYKNQFDVHPTTVDTSWLDITKTITKNSFEILDGEKNNFKHISFSTFDGYKNGEHAQKMYGLILDYDDTMTVDDAVERFKEYEFILYTSFNHQRVKNGKAPVDKFRMLFPFVSPVDKKEWDKRKNHLNVFAPDVDPSSKKFVQCYCAPAVHSSCVDETIVYHNKGKVLDWMSFPVEEIKWDYVGTADPRLTSSQHLSSDDVIRLKHGTITVSDIQGHHHCYCPFHDDKSPGAFVNRSTKGNVFLHCPSCEKTFYEQKKVDINDLVEKEDSGGIAAFVKKHEKVAEIGELVEIDEAQIDITYIQKYTKEIPIQKGCFFVRSPKGSGKTHQLTEYVKKAKESGKTVLLLGHRVNLLASMSKRLDLVNYKDVNWDVTKSIPHLAICVNSLSRIAMLTAIKSYDIVLIDESEQVINHLVGVGGTITPKQRRVVTNSFVKVIKNAKSVVCLDADLGLLSINSIVAARDNDNDLYDGHINKFLTNKTLELYENRVNIEAHIQNVVDDGQSLFLTSNSKTFVNELSDKFTVSGVPHIKITQDTAETSYIQQVIGKLDSINDLDEVGDEYKVVLVSPTLGTGVDISATYDNVVGLFVKTHFSTHYDIDQQIMRVRNAGNVSVFVALGGWDDETNWETIRDELFDNDDKTRELVDYNRKDLLEGWFDWLIDTYSRTMAHVNQSKNHLMANFSMMKKAQGWDVQWIEKHDTESSDYDIKELKKIQRIKLKEDVKKAPKYSDEEQKKVGRLRVKSKKEKNAMLRYSIEHFFREDVEDIDEIIDWWVEQRTKLITAWEHFDMSEDAIKMIDVAELEKNHLIDRKNRLLKNKLLKDGLNKLGVMLDDGSVNTDVMLSKSTDNIGHFMQWAGKNKKQIKSVVGLKVDGIRAIERPMGVALSFLKKCGLSMISTKVYHNGTPTYEYTVNLEEMDFVQKYQKKRLNPVNPAV